MTTPPVYDTVIVGGGIAGLHRAYCLLKADPTHTVAVLEASSRWGGRIYTHREGDWSLEYGAGRFQRHHRKLWRLLGELGLQDHIHSIGKGNGLDERVRDILARVGDQDAPVEQTLDQFLRRTGFPRDDVAYLLGHFGYSAEIRRMNARDAVALIADMVNPGGAPPTYYGLQGGLSQIVDRLVAWLQDQDGASLYLDRAVVDVVPGPSGPSAYLPSPAFLVQTRYRGQDRVVSYRARRVFLALPKEGLMTLPCLRPAHRLLNTVVTAPLCRIYAQYAPDPATGKVWFHGRSKQALDSPLRWFIPMNEATGTAMVAYTDDDFARYWQGVREREGIRGVKHRCRELLDAALGTKTPLASRLRMAYWASGVGYWGPRQGALASLTTEEVAARVARPLGPATELYILGENYSWNHQQWIEGALTDPKDI